MKTGHFIFEYVGSYPGIDKMPAHDNAEFCFIGRSNVGKSSLLNYLTGRTALAKTSKKPGKTQSINLFCSPEHFCFVDLPGYGYAARSKAERARWKKMIYDYLEKRQNLAICFILIDSRIAFQDLDRDFIDWAGAHQMPVGLVFTKIDGIKPGQRAKNINQVKREMLINWESLPPVFEVSAEKKSGGEELMKFILDTVVAVNDNI